MGPKKISAFDAKTHLSELLRDAQAGQDYVILRHGKPVAKLCPVEKDVVSCDFKEAAASFRELRKGIRGKLDAKALIEEGRRL